MELGLKDKVAGITGAASSAGIGFAVAKEFLREGAKVFICDLNDESLQQASKLLGKEFPAENFRLYKTDVSSEEGVNALFDSAMRDFGRIDIFINNAGIYPQAALKDMSVKLWDTVMGVNLRSVFLCGLKAREVMEKNGGGVILNASSYAAVIPSAGSAAYAASKSAVYSLTKTMAAEFAPYGIRVNGFIPGVIETGMTKQVIDERREVLESQIALNRLGKPEDVAKAVVFLAGDAASYISGTFIEISGGKLCVQNPDYGYKKLIEEGKR